MITTFITTHTPQVGNQKEQNNNMLVGRKTMGSSKMQDPNLVTDRTREEILALKEEIVVRIYI